ncbi:MAG: hypothetical protein A2729_00405 [Candidatus Buchananbacteria bacterium RIFCSPHIGHO2_01_FULL_39_14]|uniref:DUF2238 domain-containing protein n=2 Tax=Candidatus Buchananiibacteriota TaxID=1817903 RepID=A0A1G1YMI7_9BACT|nr:MAG: hypothetical protein A2729_00405 [Candidatus Buchananbacteria bacterium RIFCSPHIGHO2_01_FULL_39_14]OGY48737.1 MAG: hypothetical protein A3D39_04700 [Candidatus Buchananbacteria bacterium RIFCSPHIGHO2_02_FULL_39_17]OGY53509.1 MAG: hypothetical protein A2912_06010 [Candidatus Buchananbacteria bacterium RIFCSPLOWO2_01_FULL_40_23b]
MFNYLVKNKNYLILLFTLAYVAAFGINAFSNTNFEFLYYTFLIIILIFVTILVNQRLYLDFFIILNLSLLGFFHLLGGNLWFQDLRLYDFYIIPGIFRYDNFVHTYGSFIATLALYSLLSNYIDQKIKQKFFIFSFILMFIAMGIGTIVELFELYAVIFFNAARQVGDYYNNAFDLFFNTLGAIFGTIFIYFYRQPPKFIRRINYHDQ